MRTLISKPFQSSFAGCVALLVFSGPLLGLETARREISPLGVVGLGAGETITLRVTATLKGQGCRAQLGFENMEGRLVTRSLNVNLGPGLSASTQFLAGAGRGRIAVRPEAWADGPEHSQSDCTLTAQVSGPEGEIRQEFSVVHTCRAADCSGVPLPEANRSTLRLYVAAANDTVCRAQMGFQSTSGHTSATSRFVTLMPGRAEFLDFRPDEEDLTPSESVIPVVAFHEGDACVATAELFGAEQGAATAMVAVHSYVSPVVGLAVDPASIATSIHTLEARLQSDPDDLWAVNALAQAYDRHGERLQAIKLISAAVEVNPRASESWLLLAKFQYEQGDYRSAAVALEKCLALDPRNVTARAAYADVLARNHRLDEAGKLFGQLLEDDRSRTPAVLTSYADYLRAEGRLAEALNFVNQADGRHPDCERTLYVKSAILTALQRLPEATLSAEKVIRLDSNFRPARLLLAKLYYQQGKTKEAADQVAWLSANVKANR